MKHGEQKRITLYLIFLFGIDNFTLSRFYKASRTINSLCWWATFVLLMNRYWKGTKNILFFGVREGLFGYVYTRFWFWDFQKAAIIPKSNMLYKRSQKFSKINRIKLLTRVIFCSTSPLWSSCLALFYSLTTWVNQKLSHHRKYVPLKSFAYLCSS